MNQLYDARIGILETLLLGLLLLPSFGYSQSDTEDVVSLRNGSILYGEIVEQVPGESVTLRLLDGQEITFAEAEIEQITRQLSRYQQYRPQFSGEGRPYLPLRPGYFQGLSFGVGVGSSDGFVTALAYGDLRCGYRFRPWLQAGIGAGLAPYQNGLITPVFLEASGQLLPRRIAPYYQVQVGYALTTSLVNSNFEAFGGGLLVHPAVGLSFQTEKGAHWTLTLGYRAMQVYESYTDLVWDNLGNQREVIIEGTRLMQRYALQISFYR